MTVVESLLASCRRTILKAAGNRAACPRRGRRRRTSRGVKDSSGAVLPGVTVEAASPALIEKVRTVVTDGDGQYKVVGLVPGAYSVTFTLTGFNTVKREGIELTSSFTATVNADLRVGSLQETITVTGETPTVDIQNVVQQRVMTRDVISAIPAGTKSVASIGVLIPGVTTQTQDVGGTAFSATAIAIHGSRFNEQQLLYDGVFYNHGAGSGGNFNTIVPNDATVQEVSLEVGGTSAESPNGGLRTNIIPRDGGNTFKGFFFGSFTNNKLQADNLNDSLRALGPRLRSQGDQDLRHRPRVRRPAPQGQALVLRIGPEAELPADGRRSIRQPDADRRRPTRRTFPTRRRTTKRTAIRACG